MGGVREDAEEIILLTIAIEVEKPDECLEIYLLIDVLRCGNHSINGIIVTSRRDRITTSLFF